MALEVVERRVELRLSGLAPEALHATLRPGRHVHVVDLSQAGAQIETERPLRPGTRVHVRLVGEGWTQSVAAWVLRCSVWALPPEHGVVYRGALRFETRCPPLIAALLRRETTVRSETRELEMAGAGAAPGLQR